MHCLTTRSCAQCAHQEPRSRAQRLGHVHTARTASLLHACWSRRQNSVATPLQPPSIATSKMMSRHQTTKSQPQNEVTTPPQTGQVATSKRGCDLKLPSSLAPLSRPKNGVATANFPTTEGPCHDIKTTSRHPQVQANSRPQKGVVTPKPCLTHCCACGCSIVRTKAQP